MPTNVTARSEQMYQSCGNHGAVRTWLIPSLMKSSSLGLYADALHKMMKKKKEILEKKLASKKREAFPSEFVERFEDISR